MHIGRLLVMLGIATTSFTSLVNASPPSTLYDGPDGVTCEYFNLGALVPWKNKAGDWRDANGKAQGPTPFAQAKLINQDPNNLVVWDVTGAVQKGRTSGQGVVGLVLAGLPGGGIVHFFSRKEPELTRRPTLRLDFANGQKDYLSPTASTYTDCSSIHSLGDQTTIQVGGGRNAFLTFDISEVPTRAAINRATLQLVRTPERFGDISVGTFLLDAPRASPAGQPQVGFAAAYPGDKGIERAPEVYMAADFESSQWQEGWTNIQTYGSRPSFDTVDRDDPLRFQPLSGRALRVLVAKGTNLGLDLRYEFKKKTGSEPEEVYMRYYLRLAEDWQPTVDGGKMPGFAGTYRTAGWGDRPADPLKGWSMRGSFSRATDGKNPLHDYIMLGTYAQLPAPELRLGRVWPWTQGMNGLLERNRWYCIEQYVRLNTPKAKDGALRVWVDGQLAFEKTDVWVRDTPALKVEYVWMNVWHGGMATAAQEMHLFIDNVVIARRYVGPMAGR